jgi:hypothetical protein
MLPESDHTYLLSLASRCEQCRGFMTIVQEADGEFTWHLSGLKLTTGDEPDIDAIKLLGMMEAFKWMTIRERLGVLELDVNGKPLEEDGHDAD